MSRPSTIDISDGMVFSQLRIELLAAPGGMPVAHVDRMRGYFEHLLRTQPTPKPRLSRATESDRGSGHEGASPNLR